MGWFVLEFLVTLVEPEGLEKRVFVSAQTLPCLASRGRVHSKIPSTRMINGQAEGYAQIKNLEVITNKRFTYCWNKTVDLG
jgi:hypothetical protein